MKWFLWRYNSIRWSFTRTSTLSYHPSGGKGKFSWKIFILIFCWRFFKFQRRSSTLSITTAALEIMLYKAVITTRQRYTTIFGPRRFYWIFYSLIGSTTIWKWKFPKTNRRNAIEFSNLIHQTSGRIEQHRQNDKWQYNTIVDNIILPCGGGGAAANIILPSPR